ncbi:hypothetical protein FGU65_10185 [Methanoculleus sp. FWC-SCC1]|uniref:Uncharacterized protein n=1 Tax=Methanoculleus frigidifontis TaxID=2584085 RepID=A0ABT8MBD8_9EURY|nr:hypothetical protein [Methanoculleus sp. FWC-SCC1]MDN7025254.1 hypothetical protein [Methanoculleus sp. FWC-SCC1]
MRRAFILTALIAVALLACGCTNTASVGDPAPTTTPAAGAAAPETQTPEPSVPEAAVPVLEFSGKGEGSHIVDLETGTYILTTVREGTGFFMVELEKENCHIGLRGTDGPYPGTQALGIRMPGRYQMKVTDEGDSPWTIRIDRAAGTVDQSLPYHFAGMGGLVTGFFDLPEGEIPFAVRHDSQDDPYIWLFDEQGNDIYAYPGWEAPLRSPWEAPPSEGTVILTIPESRAYLLAVECNGNWTVDIGE